MEGDCPRSPGEIEVRKERSRSASSSSGTSSGSSDSDGSNSTSESDAEEGEAPPTRTAALSVSASEEKSRQEVLTISGKNQTAPPVTSEDTIAGHDEGMDLDPSPSAVSNHDTPEAASEPPKESIERAETEIHSVAALPTRQSRKENTGENLERPQDDLARFCGQWKCTTAGGYTAKVSRVAAANHSLVAISEGNKPFWAGKATGQLVAPSQIEMNWKDLRLLGKISGDGKTIIWSNSERWYATGISSTSGGVLPPPPSKARANGTSQVKKNASKSLAEGNVLSGMWTESKGAYVLQMKHDAGLSCGATLIGVGPWVGEAPGTLKDLANGGQVRMDFSGVVLIGAINKSRTKITWSNQAIWNRVDEKKQPSSEPLNVDGVWKADTLGYRATIKQSPTGELACTQHPPKTVWVIEAKGTVQGSIVTVAFPDILTGVVKREGRQIDWSNGAVWLKVNGDEKRQRRPSMKIIETSGTIDGLKWCADVVYRKVVAYENSWPFMRAVDPEKDQAPDYFDVVTHPMHLGEIQRKLSKQLYSTVDECLADFQRIFDNCKLYNRDAGNPIRIWCAELEEIFHKVKLERPKPGVVKKQLSPSPLGLNPPGAGKRKRDPSEDHGHADPDRPIAKRSKATPSGARKTPAKRPTAAEKRARQESRRRDEKRERTEKRLRIMQVKHCKKVLQQLLNKKNHQDNQWFREPVDVVRFGLHDYLEKVQRPMDLGTIRKNLDDGLYSCGPEFAKDVRQVWHNCRIYNPPGDVVAVSGNAMSRLFEQLWQSLPTEEDAMSEDEPELEPEEQPEEDDSSSDSDSSDSSDSSSSDSENDEKLQMLQQFQMFMSKMNKKKKKKKGSKSDKDLMVMAKLASMATSKKKKKSSKPSKDAKKKATPSRKRPPPKKRPTPARASTPAGSGTTQPRKRPASSARRTQSQASSSRRPSRPNISAAVTKGDDESKLPSISTPMSYEDKKKLTEDIEKLNDEQLSRVEKIIQDSVNLTGNGQEVMEVDVDSMDTRTLRKLERYIQSCMAKPKPMSQSQSVASIQSRPLSSAGSTASVDAGAKSNQADNNDDSSGSSSSSSSSDSSSDDDDNEPTRPPEKVNFSVDAVNTKPTTTVGGEQHTGGASNGTDGSSKVELKNISAWGTLKDGNMSSTPSTPAATVDSGDFNKMKSQALEAQEKEKRLKEMEAKSIEEQDERRQREALQHQQAASLEDKEKEQAKIAKELELQTEKENAERRREDARKEREKRMREQQRQNVGTSEDLMAVFQ